MTSRPPSASCSASGAGMRRAAAATLIARVRRGGREAQRAVAHHELDAVDARRAQPLRPPAPRAPRGARCSRRAAPAARARPRGSPSRCRRRARSRSRRARAARTCARRRPAGRSSGPPRSAATCSPTRASRSASGTNASRGTAAIAASTRTSRMCGARTVEERVAFVGHVARRTRLVSGHLDCGVDDRTAGSHPLGARRGGAAHLRALARVRPVPPGAGGHGGGELLDRDPAAERDRRAAHGPRAQRLGPGLPDPVQPHARPAHALDARHRPRRHRDADAGRAAAQARGHEPRGARARQVHRARLAVARGVRRDHLQAVPAARRVVRLRATSASRSTRATCAR